jgi:hypothetical protein
VQRAPGIPCALYYRGTNVRANLGRIAPRERGLMSDRLFENSINSILVVPAGRPGLGHGDVEMLDPPRDVGHDLGKLHLSIRTVDRL